MHNSALESFNSFKSVYLSELRNKKFKYYYCCYKFYFLPQEIRKIRIIYKSISVEYGVI